jgi:ElaB/YqjD/DUF883 family membrane-anchored ribosome-binding protein
MMPQRENELPEGTDHIINGAMETNPGSRGTGATGAGGGASSGFIGSGGTGSGLDDTGGAATGGSGAGSEIGGDMASGTGIGGGSGSGLGAGTGGGTGFGGGAGGSDLTTTAGGGANAGSGGGDIKDQVRQQAQSLKSQATDRVRFYAVDGKERATSALDEFAQALTEAAAPIDERLGSNYGEYARRAADAVQGFADNVRDRDVEDLFDDARELVRKSPAVAIGTAAAIGFALVRLIKAGMDENAGSTGASGGGSGGSGSASGSANASDINVGSTTSGV